MCGYVCVSGVCVCVYIYVCVCLYACVCVFVFVCTYVGCERDLGLFRSYIYIFVKTVYVFVFVFVCECVCACTDCGSVLWDSVCHMYVCVYVCV